MAFYDVVKQLAMAAGIIGIGLLLYHLAGQISEGSASGWTLIAGIGLPVLALLFWMIADVGLRLARLTSQHDRDRPRQR